MFPMSTAATPKGLRRRARLVEAAAELLMAGGVDAVRHRAVADRAELPLASTTYYFGSLDDLLAAAVSHVSSADAAAISVRCDALSRRRRGAAATADALAEVFVGSDTTRAQLATRYELVVLAARYTGLQDSIRERQGLLSVLHVDALVKSGRTGDVAHAAQLLAVEDGAVVGALAQGDLDAASAARDALVEVVDVLAPLSAEADFSAPLHWSGA
ncbi:TetR/AcrR family transcriptional regulator [Gordonia sp. CPCC 205333]|uniref:TetR/AcrR family transcriptional regulator n=1 Tax=Gordonia sp. CPCC 205333 TaxID=3140790 RepID=UPI003AF39699